MTGTNRNENKLKLREAKPLAKITQQQLSVPPPPPSLAISSNYQVIVK